MNCCKIAAPVKKSKDQKKPHKCGGVDNLATHLNLLRVKGKLVDGVQIYHF